MIITWTCVIIQKEIPKRNFQKEIWDLPLVSSQARAPSIVLSIYSTGPLKQGFQCFYCLYIIEFHNKAISVLHFNIFQHGVERTEPAVGHRCWCLKWFIFPLVPLAKRLTLLFSLWVLVSIWLIWGQPSWRWCFETPENVLSRIPFVVNIKFFSLWVEFMFKLI